MQLPLLLTVSRIVLAVASGTALLLGTDLPFHVTIAAVCFIVAAITDFFDGWLARAWNQVTPLGAFLDPLADKLLVYLSFIYLTVVGLYPVWLLLLVFIRDIVTDSLRAFAVGQGRIMPANLISKWKSLFQMMSIGLLLLLGSAAELHWMIPWEEPAFGATYWLMVAAAVVGIVGTAQYVWEYAPSLFLKKSSRI